MTTSVLVTGASAGIGRAVALRMGLAGCPVTVGYRRGEQRALAVVREIEAGGGRAVAVCADVSRSAGVSTLFDRAEEAFGPVGALVNNAGASRVAPLADSGDELIGELLGANLLGALYGMREAARRLASGGSIVNLSSTAVAVGTPGLGVYLAAKAGVEALTRVLAKELGPRGIRVNTVAPGLVDSPMFRDGKTEQDLERFRAQAPLRRLGGYQEIAEAVAYLLSPAASWVSAQTLRVNGGVA
ncbi:SDR family oxidoreductase [Kitasatospora sp. NPDC008050]|uniref:SDR family oxidoreductase n=1 Tax=Kitasatospora sp. NPDC008050 TaxID=3364021 RepID=UPI0036F0FF70